MHDDWFFHSLLCDEVMPANAPTAVLAANGGTHDAQCTQQSDGEHDLQFFFSDVSSFGGHFCDMYGVE